MSHFRYKITVPSVGLGAGDSAVKMPIELPSQRGNHKQSKQIDYRQWHEDDKGGTCNRDRRVAAWYTVLRIIPQIPALNKQFYYIGLANELFGQLNTLASKHIFILHIGTKIIQDA